MGGLGNQMFQYAFGKRMALALDTELVLDNTLLLGKSQFDEHETYRDFALDIFNLSIFRWATEEEIFLYNGNPEASIIKKLCRKLRNKISPKLLIIQKWNEIDTAYFNVQSDVCFVGRWQSEFYFKDKANEVRKEFSFNTIDNREIRKFEHVIRNCNAVCMHVRRGDLVTSALYSETIGALGWNYYLNAITYLRTKVENPVFFIFSDDQKWCRENILLDEMMYFMDDKTAGNRDEGHLYLMHLCKHFIISNSTFSWWGAWLSDEPLKIVVYPDKWYKDSRFENPQMCPSGWECI